MSQLTVSAASKPKLGLPTFILKFRELAVMLASMRESSCTPFETLFELWCQYTRLNPA